MLFPDFGLAEPILRAVTAAGYTTPTPIQQQAIPHILAERDVLGCAQTGTGKTAAFALPVLHRLNANPERPAPRGRKIRVLTLSPTRELATQIADSFEDYGKHTSIRQTTVFGGVSQFHQVKALSQGIDVLVATPGRLLDLIEQGYVDLRKVEILIIDEADRMFDMGFLPDLKRIIARVPTARQTLLFSATMLPEVERLASAVLRDPVQIRIAPNPTTTLLIEQSVCFVPHSGKVDLLTHFLSQENATRAVVFTRTKHGADRVVRKLEARRINATAIHGNKSQNAREKALDAFKTNRMQVLVATDVAARGIDIDGVTHVFNYDLPEDPKTYVHRIGRTGRAGSTGIAISFCDADERSYLRDIEKTIRQALPVQKDLPQGRAPTESPANAAPMGDRRRRIDSSESPNESRQPHAPARRGEVETGSRKRPVRGRVRNGNLNAAAAGGSRPSVPFGGGPKAPVKRRRRKF